MSERNPRIIAKALIAQFGASALPHARQRLEDLRDEHEVSAEMVWLEIIGELIQMTDGVANKKVH
jgi:hypothetical protein